VVVTASSLGPGAVGQGEMRLSGISLGRWESIKYIYIYVNGFHMSSWDFMGGSSPFDVFKHGSSMDWVELREDPLSGSSMVLPSSNSGGLVVSSLKNMSRSIEIILPGH
jgi:hypothetical protein